MTDHNDKNAVPGWAIDAALDIYYDFLPLGARDTIKSIGDLPSVSIQAKIMRHAKLIASHSPVTEPTDRDDSEGLYKPWFNLVDKAEAQQADNAKLREELEAVTGDVLDNFPRQWYNNYCKIRDKLEAAKRRIVYLENQIPYFSRSPVPTLDVEAVVERLVEQCGSSIYSGGHGPVPGKHVGYAFCFSQTKEQAVQALTAAIEQTKPVEGENNG